MADLTREGTKKKPQVWLLRKRVVTDGRVLSTKES